jgi:hypothetical protein
MRKREHAPEKVWQAQELYCVTRLTFRATAEQVGVAESTVKRWADKHGWREKRDKIAQAECDIRADLVLARSEMVKSLMKSKDAQTGFAVASLESLAMKQAEFERAGRVADIVTQNKNKQPLTPEETVSALRDAVEAKVMLLLTSPDGVDFKAVADIKKALELLEGMEAKQAREVGADNKGSTVSGSNIEKMLDALK